MPPRTTSSRSARGKLFRTEKVIGRGSFGTAYLVRSQKDSRLYVMKKLEFEQMPEKDRAEARNECEILMKLRHHPNIIRVHEYFIDGGRLCILMDYADGGDLAQRLEAQAAASTHFSEDQVLDWFVQICLALKHAHDRKILHRDLKPQNIFLTRKNLVRLGDFGISKVLSSTMSVASTCVGTPLYLAPELCEGREYNSKGDIWSLGVILFEMVALQPPFTAAVMPALVMKICCEPVPALPPHASDDLRQLAARLLNKDPTLRPRVHDVLAESFIHQRIERFLPAEALVQEFAHTVLHAADEELLAPPVRTAKSAGAATRPRCKAPAAGATRKATPTGRSRSAGAASPVCGEEDRREEVKLLQRREADERRQTMRRQIRQDRTQAAGRGEGFSVEIVVGSGRHAELSEEEELCRALEAANPGTRLLSDEERRHEQAAQNKRRKDVMEGVESSRVKGEAGRALINNAQRELLLISRVLAGLSKKYVLRREGTHALLCVEEAACIDGIHADDVSLLSGDDGGAREVGEAEDSESDLDEPSDAPAEAMPRLGAVAAPVPPTSAGLPELRAPASTSEVERTQRPAAVWMVSPPADGPSCSEQAPISAERRNGGIAFNISFDGPLTASSRQSAAMTAMHRGTSRQAVESNIAGARAEMPAHLFSGSTSLSSKVETLRMHLEAQLGGQAALQKVLTYVIREENGEQLAAEREEMLNSMAERRNLLPLVHTLLYLEEALGVR
ncbi:hypothetical protein AB1Y20_014205 [Prymnesium parvum]|uniref:non-specific serine/threonine protein kinase n=1 Tax=Prymnesium parvum TaxID=97485 RepID=A0AB34IDB1_PRYPA|mmetsp:Transcript_18467/g.46241  ORF Transcript_18467/g.46241 Transcript_18467/m.46241 type:complete len:734 (-) Transcript_18467:254-2455(-)